MPAAFDIATFARPQAWESRGARDGRGILDTSVVIATDVDPIEGELAVSAATLAELHYGVLVAREHAVRAERLRRLSLLQRRFDALPVDEAVATSHGELTAAVVEAGRRPRARVMDLLIAATAHAHSARLYTRNAADLIGLEDLVEVLPA
jgi:predicted nucleic acid-binding protein